MMEKGSDRRQARIACQDRVLPLLFKLVQKSKNKVSVEILDGQSTWLAPGALSGEEDQHAQGVAIAGNG
jgi:hypothetical protein